MITSFFEDKLSIEDSLLAKTAGEGLYQHQNKNGALVC